MTNVFACVRLVVEAEKNARQEYLWRVKRIAVSCFAPLFGGNQNLITQFLVKVGKKHAS